MYIQKSKVFSLKAQMLAGFVFTMASGCFLHFLFRLTGGNVIAAAFSPVNESPWEHLKIIYFPVLLFLMIQSIYLKHKRLSMPNLIWYTSLSALLAMTAVTVSYYTYSGILGKSMMWADISIFMAGTAAAYLFDYAMIKARPAYVPGSKLTGLVLLAVLGATLVCFTYFAPHIPWFEDPETGLYGVM